MPLPASEDEAFPETPVPTVDADAAPRALRRYFARHNRQALFLAVISLVTSALLWAFNLRARFLVHACRGNRLPEFQSEDAAPGDGSRVDQRKLSVVVRRRRGPDSGDGGHHQEAGARGATARGPALPAVGDRRIVHDDPERDLFGLGKPFRHRPVATPGRPPRPGGFSNASIRRAVA